MSQRTLEVHYRPNRMLTEAVGVAGYNCGYAEAPGLHPFDQRQRALVWRLLGDAPITAESIVLDVGCGIGGPSGWILDRYAPRKVIGLDYLWSNVRLAAERCEGQSPSPVFLQADAHALPLADACADVIFNLESALHYQNKDVFLGECRRVLKPGGRLCLADITTNQKALFAPLMLLNRLPTQFNSNLRLWSGDDYLRSLHHHGLEVIRHERVARNVAASLTEALAEISRRGWAASKGFRARCGYLAVLRSLLNSGRLSYDLFAARRQA